MKKRYVVLLAIILALYMVCSATAAPVQAIYDVEKLASSWIGSKLSSLNYVESFGPLEENDWYNGGRYYSYKNILFIANGEEEILSVHGWDTNLFTKDGVNLNKTRAELTKLFGNPISEGIKEPDEEDYDEEEESAYVIKFQLNIDSTFDVSSYVVSFTMDNDKTAARLIAIDAMDNSSSKREDSTSNSSSGNSNNKQQNTANRQQEEGVYIMDDTQQLKSSQGNVYRAPSKLMMSDFVQFVNIINYSGKVSYGSKIRVVTGKDFSGYKTYKIDADGRPGGTVYNVVDAVIID
jgi:hypothetical protein